MKWVIVIGFLVHLVFLASIFDIYFKSPVVTGVTPRNDLTGAPAKRLVLFVSDGLRADSLYSVNKGKSWTASYLRSIITKRGTWGVSHTHVPTESRPGHVALIAGLYEDPSAVARGWQENPVDFDSIFNRSQQTWSWGSPDILPMFAKGAVPDRVHTYYYSHEEEDFSGRKDTSLLDKWVFDNVKLFLENAKTDKSLYEKVNQDKVVFFLHLLGLDTSGHTHKPKSGKFAANLKVVDDGIKEAENMFEEFFNRDGKTAYIFTSDHGMTDWGSHGSGSSHETETPFIAWGAGINGPTDKSEYSSYLSEDSPKNWIVDDARRNDIDQADAAPLMAALIGTSTPVNSVGSLPLSYLNTSEKYMAEAYLANALQVAQQLKRKIELTEVGMLPSLHRPYLKLPKEKIMEFEIDTEKFIRKGSYEDAISLSGRLLELSLEGLNYYHTYYQSLLLFCISLSFIGWIICLLCKMVTNSNAEPTKFKTQSFSSRKIINYIFLMILTFTLSLIYLQALPFQMYIYCSLPILLLQYILNSFKYISKNISTFNLCSLIGQGIIYAVGVEILVLSFFYRYTLSIGVVCIALWEVYNNQNAPISLKLEWFLSCMALVIFPAMPIVGRDGNITLLLLGAFIWVAISIKDIYYSYNRFAVFQSILLILSAIVVYLTIYSTIDFVVMISKLIAWTILGASPLSALFSDCTITTRLSSIVKGFAAPFILLSVGHEPLFLIALYMHIGLWLKLEHFNARKLKMKVLQRPTLNLNKISFNESCIDNYSSKQAVDSSDFRRAYFFLFYIVLCFFGTGNIASLSSFDPTWVRCFVAVFAPFTMAALIIAKTLVPFLLVSCYCRAINVVVRASTENLFLAGLVFSDLMGLHFLFLVRNWGSWLDIGTSISHYVIMQATILVLLLLYGTAQQLTSFNGLPLLNTFLKKTNLKQY